MNQVILIGRVGKDPETRHLDNEKQVSTYSLATSEYSKGKDGKRIQTTDWHNIVCWNRLSTLSENYVKKGDMISIVGKIKIRSYETDSGKKYITEILADKIEFLSKNDRAEAQPETLDVDIPASKDDDLPF